MKTRNLTFIIPSFAAIVAFAIPAQAGEEMTLEQVPKPVKDAIQAELKGGKLGTIEKEAEEGEPAVYEVEYTTADGKEFEMAIDEEGKVIGKEED
ncbi:MAG TPA: hypothetical protein VM925_00390 [Labilithrix sp.]|nr:hypothetical protein [Labilithrix sp.]